MIYISSKEGKIPIKNDGEIRIMKEGGKILAEILNKVASIVEPGINTYDLESLARKLISEYKVESSFKGYLNYPAVLCTSLNNEIVHGVPSKDKILKEGDVLNIDFGVKYKGFNTDSALTVLVPGGEARYDYKKRKKLVDITSLSLEIGIGNAIVGKKLGDIGYEIQKYVEKNGFNVVRDLVGHGVGKDLHELPQVPNYGLPDQGLELVSGMVIAIEPMVVTKGFKIKEGDDGFSFETADGGLAAHFEHTVAITEKGPLVLTKN